MKMSEISDEASNFPHPKWSRFAEWVHCISVVTFDLELGQAMELIYPSHATLSEQEKTNICYLAFPDSNSGCMGDTQYHIRLRIAPDEDSDLTVMSPVHKKFNKECIMVQKVDSSHLWGFVYFRQKKDENIPRGYFQKSFIILTKLPFFNLYHELLSLIAPKYFSDGTTVLHSVCEQICTWPALIAGNSLNLHILGTVYQTAIPNLNTKTRSSHSNKSEVVPSKVYDEEEVIGPILPPHVLPTLHDVDTFQSLSGFLSQIYTLWELVLTGEPIVVMGGSPTDCSHMIQSLVAMIAPLAYCGEYRPYFTIHDSEFKEFTQDVASDDKTQRQSLMVGVTNPFFCKLLQNWPHIIRLEDSQTTYAQITDSAKKRTSIINAASGINSKYRPFLIKDKAFIKKLVLGVKTRRPDQIQSVLIRRNLLELTQSFMIPLERYMASLLPLQRDISPFKSAPCPNEFKEDDFLATLKISGPHLTSSLKGNWKGLYQRFFKSPNFKGWYQARHRELQQKLQAVQLKALSDADLDQWAKGKQEIEIIDMIMKLKSQLKFAEELQPTEYSHYCENGNGHSNNSTESESSSNDNNDVLELTTRRQLQRQIDSIIQSLPDDLKLILAAK